jgi:hypothetical protein
LKIRRLLAIRLSLERYRPIPSPELNEKLLARMRRESLRVTVHPLLHRVPANLPAQDAGQVKGGPVA